MMDSRGPSEDIFLPAPTQQVQRLTDVQPGSLSVGTPESCPNVPYENHIGAFLRGSKCQYRITSRCWEEADDLLIFSVTCLHDQQFEVQAFRNCDLPQKLYLARKRRFKRLQRSSSIHDECEQSEMRIVVCRMFGGGGIDRHRISYERGGKSAVATRDLSDAEFPRLDTAELPQGRDPSGPSYAEAASQRTKTQPSCPLEYLSTSRKGSKQRERRRDVRELNRAQNFGSTGASHRNLTYNIKSTLKTGRSLAR